MKWVNTLKLHKILTIAFALILAASNVFAAAQSSYTTKSAPTGSDKALITDAADSNKTKQAALSFALIGDCTGFPCLDGSIDGGNIIKLYAGTGSYWTALQGGAPAANRSWRLPIAAAPAAGETLVMTMDQYGQMGFLAKPTVSGYVLSSTDAGVLSWVAGGGGTDYLSLTNTTPFTPDADYEPATKKYVDDAVTAGGGYTDEMAQDAVGGMFTGNTETGIAVTYDDANAKVNFVVDFSGLASVYQPLDADLTTYAGITPSANVQSVLGAANYAAINTLLGLTIGTNVQAYDADLTTWAGITPGSGIGTWLATPSGANLAAALTTALPATKGGTGLTALGTGVATALGNAVDASGGFMTYDADLADLADGSLTGSKVSAASDTAVGVVELATTAEVVTGSDITRAVTAAGVTAKMAAPGAIGGTTPAAITGTTITATTSVTAPLFSTSAADGARYSTLPNNTSLPSAATVVNGFYTYNNELYGVENSGTASKVLMANDIGGSIQAYDADLTTWAGITPGSGVGTWLATPSGENLASALTSALPATKGGTGLTVLGTGVATALGNATGGSGGLVTYAGGIGAATATTASAGDNDTSVATTAFVQTAKKSGIQPVCAVIPAAVTTDDYPIFKAPAALTITGGSIHVYAIGGTNVVGGLDECTGTNGTCSSVTAVDSDITGTAGSDVADDGTLTNGGIASGNWIQWHTTSVSGTNTSLSVCFSYTLD